VIRIRLNDLVFRTDPGRDIARFAAGQTFAITKRDGSAATVYDAATAGSPITGTALKTDAYGRFPGWVDEDRYTITFPGTSTPALYVEAAAGDLAARQRLLAAANPDLLVTGVITRDANEAATSAAVTWPDGAPGTYTATTLSTAFPGAVDAYTITYGSPVEKTYTQPAVTRDSSGAVTNRPAITVS
jgi:hypothetical protein